MKLNVKPNPGWVAKTVGKLSTWQDLANTGGNGSTVYSAPWEPKAETLGNVNITVEWSGAVANDVIFDLYASYDGTNYTLVSTDFGTKLENDGTGHVGGVNQAGAQSNIVNLASFPGGLYKVGVKYTGDDSGDTFGVYISEQG